MERVRERGNATNLTRYYRIDSLKNAEALIRWLSDVRENEKVDISYILLRNQLGRSDEDSDSLRLAGNVKYEDLVNEVKQRNIDVISMSGTFMDKPIVVGAKFERHEVFITVRLSNKADIDLLERLLAL